MNPTPDAIVEALIAHTNVLLYGPPGTGKTYLMREAAAKFVEKVGGAQETGPIAVDTASTTAPLVRESAPTALVRWVTFHQSYSYEDFVIGLRPDPESEKLLGLTAVPGVLLEVAAYASRENHSALLAIDEVNRGNVSRIFGEFITLLERDKRLDDANLPTPTTVSVRLPYTRPETTLAFEMDGETVTLQSELALPKRVYTLASMNSVDKSIAPLDTALRRRFHVISLVPTESDVLAALGLATTSTFDPLSPISTGEGVRLLAARLLSHLNDGITAFLGADFCLGQWYLADLRGEADFEKARGLLAEIWTYRLLPQLLELFQAQGEQLAEILKLGEGGPWPVTLEKPSPERVDLGASPHISVSEADAAETQTFLGHVVSTDVPAA